MNKYIKRASSTILSALFALQIFSPITASAKDAEIQIAPKETGTTFIPFRSDYVKFISQNASKDDAAVEYVWLKLFEEELNWGPDKDYYSATALTPDGTSKPTAKWSSKYWSEYISAGDGIKSSYNIDITYNPEFDVFLNATLNGNKDFIINWLNTNPTVFHNYALNAEKHPALARGIITLTSEGADDHNYGLFLGKGYNDSCNTFLKGSASTGTKSGSKNGIPWAAKWSAASTTSSTYDIDILRFFGNDYISLNASQKEWVKTYMPWMVNDYAADKSNAVAKKVSDTDISKNTLYNLIVTSADGFKNQNVRQEFFDYCIVNTDIHVGDLIVNAAADSSYDASSTLLTGAEDISLNNTNMSVIFGSDADCDYGDSHPGGTGKDAKSEDGKTIYGDNDYDWLAFSICYPDESSNPTFYKALNELVSGNAKTYKEMQEWMYRYLQKSNIIPQDIPTGKKYFGTYARTSAGRCGKNTQGVQQEWGYKHGDAAWVCPGHNARATSSFMKPIGAEAIDISISPAASGMIKDPMVGYTYAESFASVTLTDTVTNTVIFQASGLKNGARIKVPSVKYVWSTNIKVTITTDYRAGYRGYIAVGSCDGPNTPCSTAVYCTYPEKPACADGHIFTYSYQFYDENKNPITTNSTAIPHYCIATGYCSCGATTTATDYALEVIESDKDIHYTANFPHCGEHLQPKTYVVNKGSSEALTATYSPSSNHDKLSGSSNLENFAYTNSITKVENGGGNTRQILTSANGTVALKKGAIQPGAKSIMISAFGKECTFRLYNKYGIMLDEISLISSFETDINWTFDCSDFSDADLTDCYVSVSMSTLNNAGGGHDVGEHVTSSSTVRFNSIVVKY